MNGISRKDFQKLTEGIKFFLDNNRQAFIAEIKRLYPPISLENFIENDFQLSNEELAYKIASYMIINKDFTKAIKNIKIPYNTNASNYTTNDYWKNKIFKESGINTNYSEGDFQQEVIVTKSSAGVVNLDFSNLDLSNIVSNILGSKTVVEGGGSTTTITTRKANPYAFIAIGIIVIGIIILVLKFVK